MDSVATKLCKLCGVEKPLAEMVPYKNADCSGYRHRCYDCENARHYEAAVTKLAHGPRSVLPRFEKYANRKGDDDCWLWSGEIDAGGYGVMHLPKSVYGISRTKAHRFSWELVNGQIPEGMWMLHNCDVRYAAGDSTYRRCVNPAHLRAGTVTDNNQDTAQKGRGGWGVTMKGRSRDWQIGERNPRATLSDRQVREVRRAHASGESGAELSRRYGVTKTCISAIVHMKSRISAGT